MSADLETLERQALELARKADFGDEAIRVNREIVAMAPGHQSAWTRLGRAHLEQQHFDDAIEALRKALSLNPTNLIATNLLTEVRKRRASKPGRTIRAATGFGVREFTLLETLAPDAACEALKPRVGALFDTINATSMARLIVEQRHKLGRPASKLFQANCLYPGDTGHIFAFHDGGRLEPQFNLGWYSRPLSAACFRVGLGFNLTRAERDPHHGQGQEQVLKYFDRFQSILSDRWRHELGQWMMTTGGFIQYGKEPPATHLLPDKAVDWLIDRHNAATHGWVFCGRWLFLDRADDAALLSDRSRLAKVAEDTFRVLYPIWLGVCSSSNRS